MISASSQEPTLLLVHFLLPPQQDTREKRKSKTEKLYGWRERQFIRQGIRGEKNIRHKGSHLPLDTSQSAKNPTPSSSTPLYMAQHGIPSCRISFFFFFSFFFMLLQVSCRSCIPYQLLTTLLLKYILCTCRS